MSASASHGQAGRGLTVRYRVRGVARGFAATVAMTGFLTYCLDVAATAPGGAVSIVVVVLLSVVLAAGLVPLVMAGRALVPWAVLRRPVLELDTRGAGLNAVGLVVPWSAITEIITVRANSGGQRGRPATYVCFICPDPDELLGAARLTWLRRRRVRRMQALFGTPFAISDTALDHTAQEIARAAGGFAGVPVRRR